tara:strand:- start:504 stop:794 length:291 start_codon:yes stop_codon:yes gene_type:complete
MKKIDSLLQKALEPHIPASFPPMELRPLTPKRLPTKPKVPGSQGTSRENQLEDRQNSTIQNLKDTYLEVNRMRTATSPKPNDKLKQLKPILPNKKV